MQMILREKVDKDEPILIFNRFKIKKSSYKAFLLLFY
jgi:hypothetical protein